MGSFDYQDREKDDTGLYLQAIEQGWPLKPEHLQLGLDKVVAALATATCPRTIARLHACLARMVEHNANSKHAQQYIDAVGGSGTRVLPLHEQLALMVATLPVANRGQESIVDAQVVESEKSEPRLVPVLSRDGAFGEGVFAPDGQSCRANQ
jgi:hypothetical protein